MRIGTKYHNGDSREDCANLYLNDCDPATIIEEAKRADAHVLLFREMFSNGYPVLIPQILQLLSAGTKERIARTLKAGKPLRN